MHLCTVDMQLLVRSLAPDHQYRVMTLARSTPQAAHTSRRTLSWHSRAYTVIEDMSSKRAMRPGKLDVIASDGIDEVNMKHTPIVTK